MTISDAIPVQFWVNGVETYNQKEVCGITPVCFCQPFNCSDEIRIQVTDSEELSLKLVIYDLVDSEITRLSFTETSSGVYDMSFVPSEVDICDEQIRFAIISVLPALSEYSNYNDPTTSDDFPWTPGATPSILLGGASFSYYWLTGFISESGRAYTINYTVNFGANGSNLSLYFLDSNHVRLNVVTVPDFGTGLTSGDMTITPSGDGVYFAISIGNGGLDNTTTLVSFSITPEVELASSDCLDIKTSHDCTELIRYVNSKDFADIEYTNFSPSAEFYLRIPAVFFHETNTSEEEMFETSGQTIVSLRQEIKVKRQLQVGYMPDYMHRKLLLVLAHQTVEIDGDTWVRQDPYEKVPPAQKRYPLKMANVLLTLQGYIKRNIL